MPRRVIPMVNGEYYHVFNRGVDKRDIFVHKADYLRFYQSLHLFNVVEPTHDFSFANIQNYKDKQPLVQIYAYSLLSNHFHLMIKQIVDDGISEFMKRVTGGYTSFFNGQYSRSGALFQGTYKRVHISSEEQYQYLFAYVNENHFVHNQQRPNEIMYSSSLHYQKQEVSKLIRNSTEYDVQKAQQLALDIYRRRESTKEQLELRG